MTVTNLPTDGDYFTVDDLDHFFAVWVEQELPGISCYDANGAKLWIRLARRGDLDVVAGRLERPVEMFGGTLGVEFSRGEYEVRIVESER